MSSSKMACSEASVWFYKDVSQNMRLRALEEENAELRRQIREYYVEPPQPLRNDRVTVRMFTMRRFLRIYLGFEAQDPRFPIEPYVEGASFTEDELCCLLSAYAQIIAPDASDTAFRTMQEMLAVASQSGFDKVIVPVMIDVRNPDGKLEPFVVCGFSKATALRLLVA
jgi:hypothetical protein